MQPKPGGAQIYNYAAEAESRRKVSNTKDVSEEEPVREYGDRRVRCSAAAVVNGCDRLEAAIGASLLWIYEQFMSGLVHCALAHRANHLEMLGRPLEQCEGRDNEKVRSEELYDRASATGHQDEFR